MAELVRQLSRPAGRELLDRLAREADGVDPLRLAERLRREYPAPLVSAALTQHGLRVAARGKFSRAGGMLLTRPGLEQASAEPLARWRARRYAGAGRLADLCCGIGGDLIALAAEQPVLAVDRDPVHLAMAVHNAEVYEVAGAVTTWGGDVREVGLAGVDGVFVDPARRVADGRRFPAGVSEPALEWCLGLAAQVPAVGIKAAPGLPHEAVPSGWELELVADRRDLKEAVLWSPALAEVPRRATILPGGHTLVATPGPPVPVAAPGTYLLDPNPAVTRAGLVADLARALDAWQIDPQIAFLCTDTQRHTPFARTLRVVESAPWHEREFARRLRRHGIGAVDIRRRGLAGDVERIRRRLQLTGPGRATVVLTRVRDRPWGLICLDTPMVAV